MEEAQIQLASYVASQETRCTCLMCSVVHVSARRSAGCPSQCAALWGHSLCIGFVMRSGQSLPEYALMAGCAQDCRAREARQHNMRFSAPSTATAQCAP